MTEEPDPYAQAEQELTRQGRPRPQGDPYPKCLIDAGIALAAGLPLVAFMGRRDSGDAWDLDKNVMWCSVLGPHPSQFATTVSGRGGGTSREVHS